MFEKTAPAVDIKEQIKTIAKNLGVSEELSVELAEKCYADVYYMPYGGATSFGEIDQAEAARKYSWAVDDETYKLRAIIDNITRTSELNIQSKTSAIQTAAAEYGTRVEALSPESSDLYSKNILQKIKDLFHKSKKDDEEDDEDEEYEDDDEEYKTIRVTSPARGGIKVITDNEGNKRWISVSSNAFEDLEKELFTTAALEEAVGYADQTGERGPLLIFHIPGAKVGQCDFQAVSGRFLLESGTFDDTPYGQAVVKYFEGSDEEHQTSIGFTFKAGDEEDGQYDWLRISERSICPFGTAANPWTDFKMIGEEMDPVKTQVLEKFFGADLTKAFIESSEAKTKELESKGIRYKANEVVVDVSASSAEPVSVTVTETPPAEVPAPLTLEQVTEAVDKALAPYVEALQELGKAYVAQSNEIKELRQTDDEKIAKALTPRHPLAEKAGDRPSESIDNVINPDLVKQLTEETANKNVNPAQAYADDLLKQIGIPQAS